MYNRLIVKHGLLKYESSYKFQIVKLNSIIVEVHLKIIIHPLTDRFIQFKLNLNITSHIVTGE